ncbi:SRPBCC family protein [Halobaculum sp. CBA1158]|uniref:SRPBCC family protein n=1 Tax=Halobaculum sp. CBA1158 TaxID=2904243 RepID=UPI001F2DC61D|nr:SRPBCC family protein [Halobaculum sp. CBA1158]UIO99966.1 SRPBCC family protein [Halobaculum sp. CBA1158]
MAAASHTVRVDAPVGEVFACVDEPENHVELTPSITAVSNVEPLDNGGKRLEYTYEMIGVELTGTLTTPEYVENERIVFEMDGDLTGTLTWTFEEDDGGTHVTYAAEYDLPGGVLGAVADPLAVRYNERQLRRTLENLKARVEPARSA